jgi:hypothetical protein
LTTTLIYRKRVTPEFHHHVRNRKNGHTWFDCTSENRIPIDSQKYGRIRCKRAPDRKRSTRRLRGYAGRYRRRHGESTGVYPGEGREASSYASTLGGHGILSTPGERITRCTNGTGGTSQTQRHFVAEPTIWTVSSHMSRDSSSRIHSSFPTANQTR